MTLNDYTQASPEATAPHSDAKPLLFVVAGGASTSAMCGENFNTRIAEGLAPSWALSVITLKDLGLTIDASPDVFAKRLAALVHDRVQPGTVLVDTCLCRVFGGALTRMRAMGFGPFIGLGQGWYTGRRRGSMAITRVHRWLSDFLRQLDHHVVLSESMKAAYVRLGIQEIAIDVAPRGFDLLSALPEPLPRGLGPLRVRMAGAYHEAKGQHLLVDAIERLVAHNSNLERAMSFEMIGSKTEAPAYVRTLEARARKLPPGLLSLAGPRPNADLFRSLAETDVFVYPAAGEALGGVVIEAMLCGAYPVVSLDPPLRDVVGADERAGLVIPRDASSIARALVALSVDPLLSSRRESARTRALSLALGWPAAIGRVDRAINRAREIAAERAHAKSSRRSKAHKLLSNSPHTAALGRGV